MIRCLLMEIDRWEPYKHPCTNKNGVVEGERKKMTNETREGVSRWELRVEN